MRLNSQDVTFFFEALQRMYPENDTELIRNTPWQLLVAVILSAQTTDKQVNKVTKWFFDKIKTPYDVVRLNPKERYTYIKSVNYAPTKAKNIYTTAQILTNNKKAPQYTIPKNLEKLMALPGVGIKTAKVIRHVLYDTNDIAVDTHVHRVLNRLWFVDTTTPLQTSKIVDNVIPDQYKYTAHHGLIMFGRYHSQARNPKFDWNLQDFQHYFTTYIEHTL